MAYRDFLLSLVLEAPTPQPIKRSTGRKRKAPIDMEVEAEEHQKRREVQYQSLLAPSTQSSPLAAASSGLIENSFSQFSLPSLSDVQVAQQEPAVASFEDASRTLSEMENMGYDQVKRN